MGFEQLKAIKPAEFKRTMKSNLNQNKTHMKDARVTGEKINGNKATVTVTVSTGESFPMDLVREDDGWALDVGPK